MCGIMCGIMYGIMYGVRIPFFYFDFLKKNNYAKNKFRQILYTKRTCKILY